MASEIRTRVARAVEEAEALPRLGLGRGKAALQTERRRRAEYFLSRLIEDGSVPAWVNETFIAGIFHVAKPVAGELLTAAKAAKR